MKNFFEKAIIIMMVAFSYQVANAQSVVTNISTNDFQSCKAYLAEHPLDTIKNKLAEPEFMVAESDGEIAGQRIQKGDTLVLEGYSVFVIDGKVAKRKDYRKVVRVEGETLSVVDFEPTDALDRKAVETRFEYDITDGHRRDVRGYQLSTAVNSPDGKVIAKAADKDGWAVQAEASYQLADHCTAFSGRAGLSYTGKWWMVDLMGGATRTFFSENATEDNAMTKYWAFGSEAGLWVQPFKLDWADCNRLYFGGGVGWEWYQTDSRETEAGFLQSEGNYIYPHAGVQFEHRFFATGNSLYVKAQWRQKKLVIQNEDMEVSNAVNISLGYRFGFLRNKISH